ncbi:hypothetical protein HYC85_017871 [Camellia sinensis]|uniref:Uncharacterized protein n=1 Tax=Camellia sinensis TaxID=4442 RepID=A0A7J7GWE8_CAMSI|nr:hypothetical protein HYC85_017871 [Camellia sinensis]
MTSALFVAGDAHTEVDDALIDDLGKATLNVFVPPVVAIDDGVVGVHVGREGRDGLVDRRASFDEDDSGSGTTKAEDKVTEGVMAEVRGEGPHDELNLGFHRS